MARTALIVLAVSLVTPLAGCTVAGPRAIRNGRAAYNNAIVETGNAQVLETIVRLRYAESSALLAVASVTANVSIQTSAGAQFGIGPDSNFEGNLVPLSGGVVYEENPTISYVPVQGEDHLRSMMSPVPLDLATLLFNYLGDSPAAMTLLVDEINGVQNLALIPARQGEDNTRFTEIVGLLTTLHKQGGVRWLPHSNDASDVALTLRSNTANYDLVDRLLDLLGVVDAPPQDGITTVTVRLGIGRSEADSVLLHTRSVLDLLRIAAATVDVPQEHIESGLASPAPTAEAVQALMRIGRSKSRPKNAVVAVKRHGWWYSIDATDAQSKTLFLVLEALVGARIADSVQGVSTMPVLTVPVSR